MATKITKAYSMLNPSQYYAVPQAKTQICLHHTVGGTAKSSADWWNSAPDHVSTAYLIERDGTILEVFDPSHWAYAFGLPNGTALEKKTIHIELCNWGGLSEKAGRFYRGTSKLVEVPKEDYVKYEKPHRGFIAFEKYTDAQIESVIYLMGYLSKKFGFTFSNLANFWYFGSKAKGLISHTTVRQDKSDIHPDPDLIKAIYDFAKCTEPVTE